MTVVTKLVGVALAALILCLTKISYGEMPIPMGVTRVSAVSVTQQTTVANAMPIMDPCPPPHDDAYADGPWFC